MGYHLTNEEIQLINNGKRINAIKAYRLRTNKFLKDAKDDLDDWIISHYGSIENYNSLTFGGTDVRGDAYSKPVPAQFIRAAKNMPESISTESIIDKIERVLADIDFMDLTKAESQVLLICAQERAKLKK